MNVALVSHHLEKECGKIALDRGTLKKMDKHNAPTQLSRGIMLTQEKKLVISTVR